MMETKQKYEKFSDEEINFLLKKAETEHIPDYVNHTKDYNFSVCRHCGEEIERIGYSFYCLHVIRGIFFDKVRLTSKTGCRKPEPKKVK